MYSQDQYTQGSSSRAASWKELSFYKLSRTSRLKFLDLENTGVLTLVLILLFVFVIPLFASILLLADSIQPLHDMFSKEQVSEIRMAFGRGVILFTICGISFLETFSLMSNMFVAFVCTEMLLWTTFILGMPYTLKLDDNNMVHHKGAIAAISTCILFKVCIGIFMRRKLRVWVKSKTFLRRLGKNV